MEGIQLHEERSLIRTRQVPGRTKTCELCREVAFCLFWQPKGLCSQMCFEKPELRDPRGTGEHGSTYKLRLWSEKVRQPDQGQIPALPLSGWVSLVKVAWTLVPSSTQISQGWGRKSVI